MQPPTDPSEPPSDHRADAPGDDAPTRTLITTRSEYQATFGEFLERGGEELLVFDPDGAQLGLDTRERIAQLATFFEAAPTAKLRIAVHDATHLGTRAPRFMQLFAAYSERIAVMLTENDARRAQDCFVVLDHDDCVRRPVASQARGVILRGAPHEVALQRVRFEEIWESSTSALSPTTLGL